MAAISSRLLEAFRNLSWRERDTRNRPQTNVNTDTTGQESSRQSEDSDSDNAEEGIHMDDLDPNGPDDVSQVNGTHNLNTLATGSVVNIVNSNQVHWGPLTINYNYGPHDSNYNQHWIMNNLQRQGHIPTGAGPGGGRQPGNRPRSRSSRNSRQTAPSTPESEAESMSSTSGNTQSRTQKKSQEISPDVKKLMASKIEPTHKYLKHISRNLGRDWHEVFIVLGFKMTAIESFEIDVCRAGYGIREVQYRLLLDWIGGDDDGSLGLLSSKLWQAGQTTVVEELAEMYKIEINNLKV